MQRNRRKTAAKEDFEKMMKLFSRRMLCRFLGCRCRALALGCDVCRRRGGIALQVLPTSPRPPNVRAAATAGTAAEEVGGPASASACDRHLGARMPVAMWVAL